MRTVIKKKLVVGTAVVLAVVVIGLMVAASVVRRHFEPAIREMAIAYLQKRFDSDVRIEALNIHIPPEAPLRLLFTAGTGTFAGIEGYGLRIAQHQTPAGIAPVLSIKKFSSRVDLGIISHSPRMIDRVVIEGLEIVIPPKGQRSAIPPGNGSGTGDLLIKQITVKDARLTILPRQQGKDPLVFDIVSLNLNSVGKDVPMQYRAVLTNPKPNGLIHSEGSFGPWQAGDAGDTPLQGNYTFDNADLSVFNGIAGILNSTGEFAGTLSSIQAKGTATVPDFRLKRAGNPVPLTTQFEVLVDGTDGNTTLQPVHAMLGTTAFTTSGVVLRRAGDTHRTIDLAAVMPAGNLNDVLRLAMKGAPFMEGTLSLKTRIVIPPLTGKVKEKLILDGAFGIREGHFLRAGIQSKLDMLSRKAQGQPKNEDIREVFANMNGRFRLDDQTMTFSSLTFATQGAAIRLAGNYSMKEDALDFHGEARLDARMSQTMTGWKRVVLKPFNPIFAKDGAGTLLHIKIDGDSKSPHFGLDHRKHDANADEGTQ